MYCSDGAAKKPLISEVMQEKHIIAVVRLLGLLSLATAFYEVCPLWQLRSHVYLWHQLPEHFAMAGAFWATLCVLVELVLIAKLVVAYGLFRVCSWARPVAITVLTADFIFRANGAITMFLFDLFISPMPETPIPEGTYTRVIYLWPSYVIAIISIASVLVLIQKPIKNLFAKSKSLTNNLA